MPVYATHANTQNHTSPPRPPSLFLSHPNLCLHYGGSLVLSQHGWYQKTVKGLVTTNLSVSLVLSTAEGFMASHQKLEVHTTIILLLRLAFLYFSIVCITI